MYYPRLSENFPFSFYFFKNAWKLQKIISLHKYYPAPIGTAFSIKFLLDTKVQNGAFIPNLGLCHNSNALKLNS